MSTQQTTSKLSSTIVFLSGAYLFFVTLVIAPYINFTIFSSFHSISKLIMVIAAAIISGLQLLFYIPSIRQRNLQKISPFIKKTVMVSLAGIALSILFSTSLKTSLFGMFTSWENNLLVWICYLLILLSWITYFLILKQNKLDKLVFHTLMSLAVLVAIFYAVGEYYIWKPSTGYISQSVQRISLGFRNPLFAAYFLGMLWSYSFAASFTNFVNQEKSVKHLLKTLGSTILYIGITLALVLTFTRSAILMAGITAIVLIIWQLIYAAKNKQGFATVVIAAGILSILTGLIGYSYRKEFSLRNSDLTVESINTLTTISNTLGKDSPEDALDFYQNASQYSSTQIRFLEWKWGLRTWIGSPKNFLFGTGPDTGFFSMPKYRDPIFNNFPTDAATKPFYVRSLYINALMELGFITTSGLFILLAIFLKKLLETFSAVEPAVAILFGFLLQGVFYYPTHLTIVLTLFSLAYLLSTLKSDNDFPVRTPNKLEKTLLLILVAIISFWVLPIVKAEFVINQYGNNAIPASVDIMAKNSLIPINNNVLKRFLVYHYPEDPRSLTYLETLSNSKDLDDLRIAADAFYILARRQENEAYARKSIAVFNNLLNIDDSLPSVWDALGLRYLYVGDFLNARESFTKALELKPDYWYSYMHLGEVSRQQCNPQEALTWYKKAEQYIPTAETEIKEANDEIKTPRAECK